MPASNPDPRDGLQLGGDDVRNLVSWTWGSLGSSFLDHVFILRFGPGLVPGSETPPESVIEAIVGAYALLEGIAFDWAFLGGMDLEHGEWEGIRYFKWLDRHDHDLPEHDAPSSLVMLTAIRVAEAARHIPGYRLALRDVLAAVRDRGDDAFVYAYRAVIDVARAVSSTGGVDWHGLHSHLRTTEEAFRERVQPLQDARDAVAHGDDTNPVLVLARRRHHILVKLVRQIVTGTMVNDDRIPLSSEIELR